MSYAKAGHYKLKLIGTSQSGKVSEKSRDLFIDIDDPTFESSLDGQSPLIEYVPGQKIYPLDIKITDPLVEEMQKAGIAIDQSFNTFNYHWSLFRHLL